MMGSRMIKSALPIKAAIIIKATDLINLVRFT
jgi:hypothetical protein